MARMLGRASEPKLCPYGCCRSKKYYGHHGRQRRQVRRELRVAEAQNWRRDQET